MAKARKKRKFILDTWDMLTATEQARQLECTLHSVHYHRLRILNSGERSKETRPGAPIWNDTQNQLIRDLVGKLPGSEILARVNEAGPKHTLTALRGHANNMGLLLWADETTGSLAYAMHVWPKNVSNWCESGFLPGAFKAEKWRWFIPREAVLHLMHNYPHLWDARKMPRGPWREEAIRLGLMRDPWITTKEVCQITGCIVSSLPRIAERLGLDVRRRNEKGCNNTQRVYLASEIVALRIELERIQCPRRVKAPKGLEMVA